MGRLIDADAVIGIIGTTFTDREHGNPHFFNGLATAVEIIENAEEAVVRCKECKRSSDEYKTNGGVWKTDDRHLFCKMTKHLMRVGDFCSWGERREEG